MYKFSALLLLLLLVGCNTAPPGLPLHPGEKYTTHRAGDYGVYRAGCHDAQSMVRMAESDTNELWFLLQAEKKCFVLVQPARYMLVEFIVGPFPRKKPGSTFGQLGSVWKIRDSFGDEEYIWGSDEGGRHEAVGGALDA